MSKKRRRFTADFKKRVALEARGVRHSLASVLAIATAAKLAGAQGPAAVAGELPPHSVIGGPGRVGCGGAGHHGGTPSA